jgi:hypothetical protein
MNYKSPAFGFWVSSVCFLLLLCLNDIFGQGSAHAVELISILYIVMLLKPFCAWLVSIQKTSERMLYGTLVVLTVMLGWLYLDMRHNHRANEIRGQMIEETEKVRADILKAKADKAHGSEPSQQGIGLSATNDKAGGF